MPSCVLRATARVAVLLSVATTVAVAQDRPDPSAIGNGPRALGMAHAVTAVTDDIASIGWNPAGLSFLDRPEFALVSRVLIMSTGASATTNQDTPSGFPNYGGDGEFAGAIDALEFGGFAMPFTVGNRTLAVGVAYRRFADSRRVGTFKVRRREANGRYFTTAQYFNEDGIRAISPTVALELSDRIRLGVTANILTGEAAYVTREPVSLTSSTAGVSRRVALEEREYSGLALEVGGMFQASEKLRIGLHATLPHDRRFTFVDTVSTRALTRAAPLQLNLGVMRQMNERSLLSADLRLAPWSTVDVTEDDTGNLVPMNVGVQDATGLHLGYERDVTNEFRRSAIRLGAFARRTSFEDRAGRQVSAYGATIGQSWHWEAWSFEGGVLYGRSSKWLRSQSVQSDISLTNTDFIVSMGLKRRL